MHISTVLIGDITAAERFIDFQENLSHHVREIQTSRVDLRPLTSTSLTMASVTVELLKTWDETYVALFESPAQWRATRKLV